MSQYDNKNRGAIWANKDKQKDSDPDFTGSLNVEGVEYFFDAWKRKQDASPKAPALSFRGKAKKPVHDAGMDNARRVFHDDDLPPF